jgi:hypothetical protein
VDTQSVLKVLANNVSRVKELVVEVVNRLAQQDWQQTIADNEAQARASIIGSS